MAQTVLPEKAGVVFFVSFPRKPRHIAEREMKFVKKTENLFVCVVFSITLRFHGNGVSMDSASLVLIFEILLLILFVGISAFCSSSEMSLFSLSRAKVLSYKDSSSSVERRIYMLMTGYHRTLITIIFCNMFVNSCVSMLNDTILSSFHLNPTLTLIASGVTGIVILLLFGEVSPMTLAYAYCEPWSRYVATPVAVMRKLLYPLTFTVEKICEKILDLLGRRTEEGLTPTEYLSYIDLSCERGLFTPDEAKLMKETFALRSKSVESVMRGRASLHFVSRNASPQEVCRVIRESCQAYLPVTDSDSLDTADAILSARAFFTLSQEERKSWNTSACMLEKTIFIPEQATLEKALCTMKEASAGAALAADEYGAVSGMIMREDIYSELTGRSVELDDQSEWELLKIGRNQWLFDGMSSFEFMKMALSLKVPPGRFSARTINGVFCELLGAIPQQGDSVAFGNVTLFAKTVSRNRVTRVLVTVNEEPEQQPEEVQA